ncbi:monosaccharide ABC transporter ATP-binding protein (CUT2 family) [Anseongella ginsenosidimutans]|uniref:Monosaccharide ABC transporter ATP-binding protein (CUT2 family) n=1 Tax=Anseongella ginsenosidimutans TaxID=496056 RepID=A0A4R3KTF5_9SPHI|nr:sugar ABC transporter ATP-binding protein [Anseongella ginsenosidimutans]QEC53540.1 sugar ABC transporter ATP-binding protein [Anseongella ginsenosidimutans]TCS88444.1 monosaccharide ABC transporter ATP-binding protein (CUT2 family) [Anseongella ginsenosidimutans]
MEILRAENISKSFAGVKVLDNVRLQVEGGSVHALMGENGAGKSTFMNILMGMFPPDEGSLYIRGKEVRFAGARDAIRHGLSMIHQELLVFPELTVAENILMRREPLARGGWISRSRLYGQAAELMKQLEITIPVHEKMKNLSIGAMQMVEIVKAVSNQASVFIMDEPTSAISQRETAILFRIIDALKQQGKAIIYISHKMDEIFRVADAVTVLRDGKYIATREKDALDMQELITLIVGRELGNLYRKEETHPGDVLLEVKGLHAAGARGVSFAVRKGEVMGIAGLMGSGRTSIAHAIAGMEKITSGELLLNGLPARIDSPGAAKKQGIGLVTEDRKQWGLIPEASVKHNMVLSSLKKHSRSMLLDPARENAVADREIERFRIRASSRNQAVKSLSGGNQQKVVLSGMHLNSPGLIILDEPTRGVDIGAKQEIYQYISSQAALGKAVILISSELPEILALSDRILVIREGRVKAELGREEASQELIMKYAMTHEPAN